MYSLNTNVVQAVKFLAPTWSCPGHAMIYLVSRLIVPSVDSSGLRFSTS